MPNYVTTKVVMPTKAAQFFTRETTEKEKNNLWRSAKDRVVDFETILPTPPNMEKGNCSGQHKLGEVCWFKFLPEYWGTKWNAFSSEITYISEGSTEVKFETAWNHPFPVMRALSLKFLENEFFVQYADEDTGYNLGEYSMKNGEVTAEQEFNKGSLEAVKFATYVREDKVFDVEYIQEHYDMSKAEAQEYYGSFPTT